MKQQLSGAAFAVALLVLTGAVAHRAGESKVAFVNSDLLLGQAPGRVEAEAKLAAEISPLQKEFNILQDSVNGLRAKAQAELAKLDSAAREKRYRQLHVQDSLLQTRMQAIYTQVDQLRVATVGPLTQLVRTSIEAVREENGYSGIWDISVKQGRSSEIVSIDKNLDITDKVIAQMKIEAAKKKPVTGIPLPKKGE